MPAKDTQASHEFDLAGKAATLRCSGWNEKPWLSAIGTSSLGNREFNTGGIGAPLADDVESRNEQRSPLNDDVGIITPRVEEWDVADSGLGGVGDLEELSMPPGLGPTDPTHSDDVELKVRSALLSLSRKIGEKPPRKQKRA